MKRILMGIGAAAGMAALTACGAAGAATQTPSGAGTAGGAGAAAPAAAASTATPRCTTADLAVSLGKPVEKTDAKGQFDVPLTYRNTSDHTCGLYGVPGVDLVGPDDATFGPVYHLPRENNGVKYNEVPAGTTASATITVLTPSEGGASWTPTSLKTIPPGQTQALTAAWPADLPVLRQDAATHPGTYVNGILADPA
ncbi:DUF4232 domain-containing protein [Amycolatopsis sp., V23-08]|uniref:DUF4232 domain-containing protein n=1 Tax=Amycolatopsis heterodermiae TaxID=3110235 RepID=A0ABU5QYY1_9PSEU|nr:DUF4232 domain-containing protein [Amycolatopsis sp., V23-08]MEA5359142.1 DUF4232 domain-containing protein [Amycolatopsis sp., V23-08]